MSLLKISRLFAITSLGLVSAAAFADPTCTIEPESSWIPLNKLSNKWKIWAIRLKCSKSPKPVAMNCMVTTKRVNESKSISTQPIWRK